MVATHVAVAQASASSNETGGDGNSDGCEIPRVRNGSCLNCKARVVVVGAARYACWFGRIVANGGDDRVVARSHSAVQCFANLRLRLRRGAPLDQEIPSKSLFRE